MNSFSKFNQVYCLNLDDRTDRWELCLENFQKYNIDNYKRFSAIRVGSGYSGAINGKRLGQISCAMSFCAMIDDAINSNFDSVLFLEDDFEFTLEPDKLNQKLEACLLELPDDWDSFYLGANVVNEFIQKPLQNFSTNLLKLDSGFALHSVAFSRQGLLNIKKYFDNNIDLGTQMIRNYEAIDVFFAQVYQPNQKCFICNELLSLQRPDFSSIESNFYDYTRLMIDRFNYFKSII